MQVSLGFSLRISTWIGFGGGFVRQIPPISLPLAAPPLVFFEANFHFLGRDAGHAARLTLELADAVAPGGLAKAGAVAWRRNEGRMRDMSSFLQDGVNSQSEKDCKIDFPWFFAG